MKRHSDAKLSISRRKFLQTAGWAAMTPVLPGLLAALAGGAGILRVGLLLPSSELYPDIGKNFLAGMDACRKASRSDALANIEYIVKNTGIGQARVLKTAQKLIESEHIHLITGIIDPSLNPELVDLCKENRVILMANNAGANVYNGKTENPFLFENSLQYWQANYAMGLWAAKELGQRAVVAASFFESGYDAMYAFTHGFEDAGGKILKTVITKKPDQKDDSQLPVKAIEQLKPDLVFASYSGADAVEFIRLFTGAGLAGKSKLVASGFMMEHDILEQLGPEATGIISCHSWLPALVNEANAALTKHFRTDSGRTPDGFAVLGFETAALMDVISGPNRSPVSVNSLCITGPRGQIKCNPGLAGTETSVYIRQVKLVNGKPQNSVVAELNGIAAGMDRSMFMASGPKTGWLNTYLCV